MTRYGRTFQKLWFLTIFNHFALILLIVWSNSSLHILKGEGHYFHLKLILFLNLCSALRNNVLKLSRTCALVRSEIFQKGTSATQKCTSVTVNIGQFSPIRWSFWKFSLLVFFRLIPLSNKTIKIFIADLNTSEKFW